MHRGIDIAAASGEPVVAARAGRVTFAGPLGSSGLTVAIATADGRYDTAYLHLSEVAVDRGAAVGAGSRVGRVGTTGTRSAAEPHLHFGVRLAGREDFYLDPLTLLPALPAERPSPAAGPLGAPLPARTQPALAAPNGRPLPVAATPRPLRSPARAPAGAPARAPVWAPAGLPAQWEHSPSSARPPVAVAPRGQFVSGLEGASPAPARSGEPTATGVPDPMGHATAIHESGAHRAPRPQPSSNTPVRDGNRATSPEQVPGRRAGDAAALAARGGGFDAGRVIAVLGLAFVAAAILAGRRERFRASPRTGVVDALRRRKGATAEAAP
jgi:hypothetical protein